MSSESGLQFCRRLPKVELHSHLNGSFSLQTIERLVELKRVQTEGVYEGLSEEERRTIVMDTPKTMEEVFKIFPIIQSLTTTPEAVKMATQEVMRDFEEDGTVYLELRSTPKATFMSKEDYVNAIASGIREYEGELVCRILLSIDRRQTVEEARDTVELAIKDSTGLIVGVELSGDPSVDGRKFIPLFEEARKAGVRVAVHLAEVDSNLDEVDEFISFGPDRIGHGTFLNTHAVCATVAEKKIPLEICLSSNLFSKTTRTVEESHLKDWFGMGHPISICTDDKGMLPGCSLSGEYALAQRTFNFSPRVLWQIARGSLEQSFLDKNSEDYGRISKRFASFEVEELQ